MVGSNQSPPHRFVQTLLAIIFNLILNFIKLLRIWLLKCFDNICLWGFVLIVTAIFCKYNELCYFSVMPCARLSSKLLLIFRNFMLFTFFHSFIFEIGLFNDRLRVFSWFRFSHWGKALSSKICNDLNCIFSKTLSTLDISCIS